MLCPRSFGEPAWEGVADRGASLFGEVPSDRLAQAQVPIRLGQPEEPAVGGDASAVEGRFERQGVGVSKPIYGVAQSCMGALRHFKPLLKRAGLPDIRWHDLRH